jgi:hypothetical protein
MEAAYVEGRVGFISLVVVILGFPVLPRSASAQSAIAGVVRDSSGAVLPGVTIEATSPALIERTRSATSNESGQYRVVDLRPGMYTVTFTLPGFSTVVREGHRPRGAVHGDGQRRAARGWRR